MGLFFVLGMFVFVADASAQNTWVDVRTVQQAIRREGAEWQARENWVSRLSKAEIQRMLGMQEPPQGGLDYEAYGTQEVGIVPAALDWRNHQGISWLGPMMNQGNCGSCVAFAAVASLEARVSVATGLPWLRPSFSPQALFACGGGGCDSGWLPGSATRFLKTKGVPDEACLPYTSGSSGEDVGCSEKCADADARSFRIAGVTTPSSWGGGSAETVKKALLNGPLITSLRVYADFVTYSGGIYKHVSGEAMGGHAVSLVGYDNAKKAWLIRNSWGEEWGEKGYGWISWSDTSGIAGDTWAMEVPSTVIPISVKSPADREYVSGEYRLEARTDDGKIDDLEFLLSEGGKEVSRLRCANRTDLGCSAVLDTTRLREGRYEIYVARASAPALRSQVREFFVLNSEPRMQIAFEGAPGVDLSKPLTGRPEFVITVDATPVPVQRLEFRVLDASGALVTTRSNDVVLPKIKMGWRTSAVQPGRYRIHFRGITVYRGKVYQVDSAPRDVVVK